MWIVPKSIHSVCALDTEELTSDSSEFCQRAEQSLMWRSKPSPAPTWLRRWKRESWLQLLSGRTLSPLTEEHFEAEWTSSLGDSRASLSLPLAIETPTTTPDTCSPTSSEQLSLFSLAGSSSKTSKDSSAPSSRATGGTTQRGLPYSSMSSENWKDEVTKRRGEYSRRLKSAHLTREKGCLSWLTPRANEPMEKPGAVAKRLGDRGAHCHGSLSGQIADKKNWPTVSARDWKGTYVTLARKDGKMRGDLLPDAVKIEEELRQWATPHSNCHTGAGTQGRQGGLNLQTAVQWPTPQTVDGGDARPPRYKGEAPSEKGNKRGPDHWGSYRGDLKDRVAFPNWPTSHSNKPNHGQLALGNHPEVHGHEVARPKMNKSRGGQPDQGRSSSTGKPHGQLNPDWVEQLMGLPIGWTDLGSWGTE